MSIFSSGLRFRLVTLVLAAVAPFLILIALVARQHQVNEKQVTQGTARNVAADLAKRIDSKIGSTELALLALRQVVSASPRAAETNGRILKEYESQLPRNFASLAVITRDGKTIGSSDSVAVARDSRIFLRGQSPATPGSQFRVIAPFQRFGDRGPLTLAVLYPLDSSGTNLVLFIPASSIQREAFTEGLPEGSVGALVNESGIVVAASTNPAYWKSLKLKQNDFSPSDSNAGIGILAEPNGSALYAGYAKLEHAPYRMYVGTPEPVAFAKARRDFWRAIGWGALALLLGVVLAWSQATRIIRPLDELAADAAILGRGELGHRSRVRSMDELGHLADSINSMAGTLERREQEAIQAQKMESVGQLAGGIAHDFNNLLTVISGRLELLASSEALDADQQEDVNEIRSATTRAVSLTRQLLAFSRKQLLRPKTVDINSIVDELEPMLRRLIGEDVQIVILRQAKVGNILADPGQVHQVLLNLSLNARDAMPMGGMLRIETSNETVTEDSTTLSAGKAPGDYVVVAVTDSGHGMDERTKARIFDPFFTTKAPGKGTGLGLSTVYGIVKQSGATITVDTAPNRGTTFRIFFPIVLGRATGEFAIPAMALARGTETILLVEDERAVRDLATKILQARGYTVISAAHGGDALQILAGAKRKIDLVITDVVMPGMSGRELVDMLRSERPGIKVLFMSGYTDDEIMRRGLLDPAVDFIQKPFSAEELATQTRKTLDG